MKEPSSNRSATPTKRPQAAPCLSRRSFAKLASMSAVSICLGSAASACSKGGDSTNGETNTTNDPAIGSVLGGTDQVVVAMNKGSEPAAGFNPLVAWGCGEHVHEPLIQSTLISTDENLNFVNDLATSYECSEDGLTWTFHLREDARFSDGTPLTSADVAFTINSIVNSENAEADLSTVKEATAPDASTACLLMKKPCSTLLYTLAVVGIVPEHAYDEGYGEKPIGSGRYLLEQWDKGQQVILTANPDYYGEAPAMKRIVVLFMDEDAALAAVKAGQVDIAYTSATFSNITAEGYELQALGSVDSRGISLPSKAPGETKKGDAGECPVGNAVTCDLAVRQAMNYALDRTALIDNVLNGYGVPAYSVSDGMPWSSDDMYCPTNLQLASTLLDGAGWVPGKDGIRYKEGTRCSVICYYPADDSVRQAMAAEFINQMRDIGIEVISIGSSWDDIYQHEFSDLVLWGWGSNSPTELYELNHSKGWGNFSCYENGTVDAHLNDALAQTRIEDSYEHWQKAQWDGEEGIAPQGAATWVWLANIDHLYFVRQGLSIGTQKPHPHGHGWSLVNNVDRWSWA